MGPSRASLNEEQSDGVADDAAAAAVSVSMSAMCSSVYFKGLPVATPICYGRSGCFCECTVRRNTI